MQQQSTRDHELASLLSRWHHWRAQARAVRGYATARLFQPSGAMDDDDFEQLLMRAMEDAISELSRDHQLAIQHVARAECLGVEVLTVRALLNPNRRETVIAQALERLRDALTRAGVI